MQIAQNTAVSFHYHLTNSSGIVIDSSVGKAPRDYLHGFNQLVPGVERALVGKQAGAKLKVEVPPEDGYGPRDPALDITIPIATFPPFVRPRLQPGAKFEGPHPADRTRAEMYTVLEVVGSDLHCTANHPLAGMTLHYQIEVMEVRDATPFELRQGRVLPPDAPQSARGCCSDPNCKR